MLLKSYYITEAWLGGVALEEVELTHAVLMTLRLLLRDEKFQVHINLASFPGPSRGGGERAWYTLHAHAHAPGDPRKMWDNRILLYTLCLLSIELYVIYTEPVS